MEQIFGDDDPEVEAYCNSKTEDIDLYEYRSSCFAAGTNGSFDATIGDC
jgi:hypothetical protein